MADETSSINGGGSSDLNLTAIINALDAGEPMPELESSGSLAAFDPNATMNYHDAGESYPDLPFAEESPKATAQARRPSTRTVVSRKTRTNRPTTKSNVNTETRRTRNPLDASDYDSTASSYRPIDIHNSTYRIRGGGGFRIKSPLLIALSVVFVVAGVGVLLYGVNSLVGALAENTGLAKVELTTTQTREAIDSRIPVLVNYVDSGIEDVAAMLSESGQNVYPNGRYSPESLDVTAVNSEILSMPNAMTDEQLQGFFEGSYNAYSPEELAQFFNGAYALDLARGDLGSWNKLRYANFNVDSIDDEIANLRAIQQLSDETTTVVEQGVDSRGNTVVQGTKVIRTEMPTQYEDENGELIDTVETSERILYFKIAACPFTEVYTTKKLGGTSVYITCTLSTYDFYTGSGEVITPA